MGKRKSSYSRRKSVKQVMRRLAVFNAQQRQRGNTSDCIHPSSQHTETIDREDGTNCLDNNSSSHHSQPSKCSQIQHNPACTESWKSPNNISNSLKQKPQIRTYYNKRKSQSPLIADPIKQRPVHFICCCDSTPLNLRNSNGITTVSPSYTFNNLYPAHHAKNSDQLNYNLQCQFQDDMQASKTSNAGSLSLESSHISSGKLLSDKVTGSSQKRRPCYAVQSSKPLLSHWSDSQVRQLIIIFRHFPCLYDTKHPDYVDEKRKDKALEFATTLVNVIRPSTSQIDVLKKFEELRAQYIEEVLKLETSVSLTGKNKNTYFSKLRYFDDLSYLRSSFVLTLRDVIMDGNLQKVQVVTSDPSQQVLMENLTNVKKIIVADCLAKHPSEKTENSSTDPSIENSQASTSLSSSLPTEVKQRTVRFKIVHGDAALLQSALKREENRNIRMDLLANIKSCPIHQMKQENCDTIELLDNSKMQSPAKKTKLENPSDNSSIGNLQIREGLSSDIAPQIKQENCDGTDVFKSAPMQSPDERFESLLTNSDCSPSPVFTVEREHSDNLEALSTFCSKIVQKLRSLPQDKAKQLQDELSKTLYLFS